MSYIIAVDFDGTLCENKYPEIGKPNSVLIDDLKMRKDNGAKLILWTCRVGDRLEQAIDWCQEQGLIFDAVNQNLPEIVESFGGDCRKVFAHEYIDDRNIWDRAKYIDDRTVWDRGKYIAYLCDGTRCRNCDPEHIECHHTFDIRHAKNFKKVAPNYYEEATIELMTHSQKNNHELITRTNITA